MTLRARWILPLLDLLFCFALTTPLHRYIAPKPESLSAEVILLTRDVELPPLPVSSPVARTATSIESHLGLNAWFDMAFSVMSFLASLVLLGGLIFQRDFGDEVRTSFAFSVGVMWLLLSTNCFACRVWQWRLRRKRVQAI